MRWSTGKLKQLTCSPFSQTTAEGEPQETTLHASPMPGLSDSDERANEPKEFDRLEDNEEADIKPTNTRRRGGAAKPTDVEEIKEDDEAKIHKAKPMDEAALPEETNKTKSAKSSSDSDVDDEDSLDDSKKEKGKSKEDIDEDRLLDDGEPVRPSRTKSANLDDEGTGTSRTVIRAKAAAHVTSQSITTTTRAAKATGWRDRADDQLNGIMNSKQGPLETKYIILIVAVVLILFTFMALAAFFRRRLHRVKQADEQKERELEEKRELEKQRQNATFEDERVFEVDDYEDEYWQQPAGYDSRQRYPNGMMRQDSDPYHMKDRLPYGVV